MQWEVHRFEVKQGCIAEFLVKLHGVAAVVGE